MSDNAHLTRPSRQLEDTNLTPDMVAAPLPVLYELALRRRMLRSEFEQLSLFKWPPIFVCGLLMLPGTLSSLLDKKNNADVLCWMTPAILPGHHRYVIRESNLPAILPADGKRDYVDGMIIFGQGVRDLAAIEEHEGAKCRKEWVIAVVMLEDGSLEDFMTWAFVWSGEKSELFGREEKTWSMGGFLAGAL
ncbi:hypothetical protein LTR04_007221 [Oleoguttula sp. CCFEE 6159]|nr:hypothetical protein LTR04_007221 [Oleoguttula sp. CCFEE 6159]